MTLQVLKQNALNAHMMEFRRRVEELFSDILPELFELYTTFGTLDYLEPRHWNRIPLDEKHRINAVLHGIAPF